jgi:outer membrane protein OmpA-like peptidoglycan-associated protein
MVCGLLLAGCASSNVSRDVSSNVDMGVENAKNLFPPDGNIANSYQNTSQATKGAIIGGSAGAVTGALSSSIGFLPGTAVGLILGASYGSYIDANANMQDQLDNRGANIIVLGDDILIMVPSARLFDPMTARINPSAYSTLVLIVKYINSYPKTLVKVAAYTNNSGSECVNLSLSEQQAKNVAKFLLESGVDARLLYAEGYGGTHLVDKSSKLWDGSDNYRIEITLQKLHI